MTHRSVCLATALAIGAAAGAFTLPTETHATAENGLEVIVVPSSRVPMVAIRLVVRAGSADDPPGKEGLAALTASLLTQGAGPRTAPQIAFDLESVGGTLSAQADRERTAVSLEVLSRDFDLALALLHDVVMRPTFAEAEVARQKAEAVGSIQTDRDDPSHVADDAILPMVFGDGAFGHPPGGWEKSVAALTREDVIAFHATRFRPDRAMLVIVGDVSLESAMAKVKATFQPWARPATAPAPPRDALELRGDAARPAGLAVRIVALPDLTQSQIRLSCPSVPRNHPDHFPMMVANTVLGGGFTSRLVDEIRVTRGMTYRIGSRFDLGIAGGRFGIATFTKNETLRPCVDAILEVVAKLVASGPTDEELAKAKRYLEGQHPLGLQAPGDLAAQIADRELHGMAPDYLTTYDARVDAVTIDDCRRALSAHVCARDLDVLVVGDPDAARKALEGLGPIEVVPVP
ncbi:MAG: pitrilysin family protein [Acidobacteriota bacterium]